MPSIIARPDITQATIAYLLGLPDVVAHVDNRIGTQLGVDWNMPEKAIILRPAGGPVIPDDVSMHIIRTRLDIFCYGGELLEDAIAVWRVLDPALCPGQENIGGFRSAGCLVYDITPERSMSVETDLDTGWLRASCSYIARWSGKPI